jgi:hypothetical protein
MFFGEVYIWPGSINGDDRFDAEAIQSRKTFLALWRTAGKHICAQGVQVVNTRWIGQRLDARGSWLCLFSSVKAPRQKEE